VVEWLPSRAPNTPFPPLTLHRTLAVSGGAPRDADALIATLAAEGVGYAATDPLSADVLVCTHGLHDDLVPRAFADATRLASRSTPVRALVAVTRDTADGAAYAALMKTAALEWGAAFKCITLEREGDVARMVAEELVHGGTDEEVRLADERTVCVRVPAACASTQRPLPEGVWLISGGARGITAACAEALARAGARRIVLLGRTAPGEEPACCASAGDEASLKHALIAAADGAPNLAAIGRQAREILAWREIRASLETIRAAGADVRYESIDVTDASGLVRVVAGIRASWGPIRGVVHAAGVVADKRLGEKTQEQFEAVFRTKAGGARALLEACANDPLEQICFFSSVAAHAGNPGQADYAAANAWLERVALDEHAARQGRCRVVSIAWGPWDGGMVDAALARHFATRDVSLIPLDDGARTLVNELTRGTGVQVILGSALGRPESQARRVHRFDLAALPMLQDHRIDDVAVLPMAFALDALMAEGRRIVGLNCEVRNLRLMHGVVFDGERVELDVQNEPTQSGGCLTTLRHPSGRSAYRAEIHAAESAFPPALRLSSLAESLPEDCRAPYARALFHGPAFRAIRAVVECTAATISGRIATAAAMGWPRGWQLDPLALDGALQLLRLWGVVHGGQATLPTEIARCRAWMPWPDCVEVGCVVACRRDSPLRISGDARFVDLATGAPLLSLDGIVMHARA
jgi:NAD(P)-dependent dehydrogenase (short-subunit alcohol dehydrogenase family)